MILSKNKRQDICYLNLALSTFTVLIMVKYLALEVAYDLCFRRLATYKPAANKKKKFKPI